MASLTDFGQMIASWIFGCETEVQELQQAIAETYEGVAERLPGIDQNIDSKNAQLRELMRA